MPVNKQNITHAKTAIQESPIITIKYKFQDLHLVFGNPH